MTSQQQQQFASLLTAGDPTEGGFTLGLSAAGRAAAPPGATALRIRVLEAPYTVDKVVTSVDIPLAAPHVAVGGLWPTTTFRCRPSWVGPGGEELGDAGPPLDMDTAPAGCVPKDPKKQQHGGKKGACGVQ